MDEKRNKNEKIGNYILDDTLGVGSFGKLQFHRYLRNKECYT
ncbi:hypothetical protein SARC_15930 [Sphaeroforma arctica JP610]|uniref:Protein kinase domain-containing protein n=1 Tax=Sphaeroforma arctica JP610 TaxID=667725 RepID=A0A0L0F4H4_9EUKA|nr:hypothetical protein SARC_15930 [Sphaeroforma arctica JP610]KNC71526.1 hypothetical protein SARC_15930 [Sphaeroforma arctica JP610]|eukprot:XP_014145428.1 hypothetical protein SARC_15930 [Sphaeroforma arctica JP610]